MTHKMQPLPNVKMLLDTPNVFAKILAGELPVSWVYQDELVVAFMDIQPVNAGHVLVIPRKPVPFLHEVDDETAGRMMVVGRKITQAIRESNLKCEGINLFLADGSAAGQEVPHVHLHIFPRFTDDGFGLRHPPNYFELPMRAELDEVAEQIRSVLNS